jgi:hypothetical protein
MKSLAARFSVLAMLAVFSLALYFAPNEVMASPQYCGNGTFACGDLTRNGACCWANSEKCCYVSPDRGSCYCVLSTDRCNRY